MIVGALLVPFAAVTAGRTCAQPTRCMSGYVLCVCPRLWLDGVLQEAREVIEAAGVVLFKDASANKGELELVFRARVRLTWALEVLRVLVLC